MVDRPNSALHPNPANHKAPSQTAPDIFAARLQFGAGEGNEGSWHQWRLSYTLAGRCATRTDKENFMAEAGTLYVTRPHVWMALRACADFSVWDTAYAVFHPRPHWHAWLDELEFRDGLTRLQLVGEPKCEFERALLNVVCVYETEKSLRDEHALLALEGVLLKLHGHNRVDVAQDLRVRNAIAFIHAHHPSAVSLREIGRAAGLSVPHLTTLFSAAVGATPGQYLERVRLARASEMLRFSVSDIGQIARSVGYADPNYFARRFLLHYGQTPRAYRSTSRPAIPRLHPKAPSMEGSMVQFAQNVRPLALNKR